MTALTDAVNLGPILAADLEAAGIADLETLERVGAVGAWTRLAASGADHDCAHTLLALEGAIRGVRWTQIPAAERAAIVGSVRDG